MVCMLEVLESSESDPLLSVLVALDVPVPESDVKGMAFFED